VIVTFYSYKGGVGRSMALANVAAWFRLQGLHVVMIDWDLEAPGLESFFATDSPERDQLRTRVGLVDLIGMYKDVFPSLPKPVPGGSGEGYDPLAQFIEMLDEMLPPIAHTLIPIRIEAGTAGNGKLSLLSAGCRSESRFDSYAQTVQQFDWEEFYERYQGEAYFEWMRRQLLKPGTADVVLIDSRTGVAEMSGVCTRQLADVVVMLCAPNEQNLEGVTAMARSFTRPDVLEARRGRPIELLPVPARVDVSEGRPVDLFEERFRDRLKPFIPELLQRLPASKNPLRIPYIREYAYAEQLAIGDADGVKILQQAYVTLAAYLVALADSGSAIKRQCRSALQETFGLSSILVASLDPANDDFASRICALLDAAGVMAVRTTEKPEAALETASAAPRGATPYGAMVLATRSYGRADTRIRDLWRRSRQLGVTLALAVEAGESAGNEGPGWSGRVSVYDVTKDFDELVHALQSPIHLAPIPFMAPPVRPGFVGRTGEIEQIKELLGVTPAGAVVSTGTSPPTRAVAIVGLGGIGKTALARAVCHDDEVIDKFDDGIVWMSLGSEADLLNAAVAVLSAFGEEVSGIMHIDEAERRIAAHLSSKRCLVIVDAVFDVAHLRLISSIGPQARAIVTTRTLDIATAADATPLALAPLSTADARSLIGRHGLSPEVATELSQKLDNQPLALELAEQTLRRGVRARDLIERIDDEGLTAIDEGNSRDASVSLFASLMSALEALPQEDRLRLPMLASLPSSQPVDLPTFAKSSGIKPLAGEAMARRMAAMSLIAFDGANQTVTISPLVHAFFRSLQLRQGRVEANRRSRSKVAEGVIGISYRRDSDAIASRLYDRLSQHFGLDRVFVDDAILPGEDFVQAIRQCVAEAAAWLVVIGPNWAQSVNSRGERRLDDREDFVRIEVATALERDIPVIPVLVAGAAMPRSEELPLDLQGLAYRQGIALDHSAFHQGVDKLIYALEKLGEGPTSGRVLAETSLDHVSAEQASSARMQKLQGRRRRVLAWTVGAAAVLALLGGLIGVKLQPTGPLPPTAAATIFERAEAFYFGREVPQNYEQAVKLYERAAADGYAPAENALGRMYENGIGVSRDLVRALEYYKRAASKGHPDAKAALVRLEGKQ
jgi:hypothetical protein